MSQIPTYDFALLTDRLELDQTGWLQTGAGTAWTNPSGNWFVSGGASSAQLYKTSANVFDVNDQIDLLVVVSSVATSCRFKILISNGLGTAYGIHDVFLPAGTRNKYIRITQKIFAAGFNTIRFVADTSSALDVTITVISVKTFFKNSRVITPGNFKSINYELLRSPDLHGIGEYLTGTIELFGDDWVFVRNLLLTDATTRFLLKLTINGTYVMPAMLLDTLSFNALAHVTTYRATVAILKETAWSNFISALNTSIALENTVDVSGRPVLDAGATLENILEPNAAGTPELTQKFSGGCDATVVGAPITINNNQILYIGFGDTIVVNEGFETAKGINTQPSLVTKYGKMRELIGTLRVDWNATGGAQVQVQAVLVAGGGYVNITTGVTHNINISYPAGSGNWSEYRVRIVNTSGSTQTFNLLNDNSRLIVTTKVMYTLAPIGLSALHLLKAYLDRMVGVYENANLDIFMESIAGGSAVSQLTLAPVNPPARARESNYAPSGNQQYPNGRMWIGEVLDWTWGAGSVSIVFGGAGQKTNLWLLRGIKSPAAASGSLYSAYILPNATYRLNVTATAITGTIKINVFGVIGGVVDFLGTGNVSALGDTLIPGIVSTKLYEAFGVQAESLGGSNITITDFSFTFTTYPNFGPLADNRFFTGNTTQLTSLTVPTSGDPIDYVPSTSPDTIILGIARILGVGIDPISQQPDSLIKFNFKSIADFYLIADAVKSLDYEAATITVDSNEVTDVIGMGGPIDNSNDLAKQVAAGQTDYATNFFTVKQKKDWTFGICLDTFSIVNRSISNRDVYMLNVKFLTTPSDGLPQLRTTQDLIFTSTQSTNQFNWVHTNGRILRRNQLALFNSQTNYMRSIYASGDAQATVDYPADGFGPISDNSLVKGVGAYDPFLVEFETAFTLADLFGSIIPDKYKRFILYNGTAVVQKIYIKSIVYNFATAKAVVTGWITKR